MINLTNTRIRRANKNAENPYVMIRKATVEDELLTWEARGILAYVLAKPDDWSIHAQDLIRRGPAGKHKIYKTINELVEYGYFERIQIRVNGKIARHEIIVHECPLVVEDAQPTLDVEPTITPEIKLEIEPETEPEQLLPENQQIENIGVAVLLPDSQEVENQEVEPLLPDFLKVEPLLSGFQDVENQDHTNNTFLPNNNLTKEQLLPNNNNNKEPDPPRAAEGPNPPSDVVVVFQPETPQIIHKLHFHGIGEEFAQKIFANYEPEYLQEKIDLLESQIDKGIDIKNPSGYLVQAIYENYQTSSYTKKDPTKLTDEERRKKYIPDKYKDIIRG